MKKVLFFVGLMPLASFAQKQGYNPFESIGKKVEVVTLSNGRYKETYGGDTVKRIGNVMFDVRTNKIVKFLEENDTTTYEFRKGGDLSTRWLSIDPLAAKYPYLSPYNFVTNNPIIYVDQDGRENVVYLVVANDKTGKPSLSKETAQKIANETNKIYENLGLKTRVIVYDGKDPFNPKYMDKTDAVAVVGKSKEQTRDYIEKHISKDFAKNELDGRDFTNSKDNPEVSQNTKGQGGNIIAIGFDAVVNDFLNYENVDSKEKKVGFVVAHGTGHNSGYNHDYGIMADGNKIKWNRNTVDKMAEKGVLNDDYVGAMKKRFGTKDAKANYNEKKKTSTGN